MDETIAFDDDDEYHCPMLDFPEMNMPFCYEIQTVIGGWVNPRILDDLDYPVDYSRITRENWEIYCIACPFNKLPPRKKRA